MRPETDPCAWPECAKPSTSELPICTDHRNSVYRHVVELNRRPRPEGNGRKHVVYYLKVGDLVKVGYTHNLQQRLRQYPPHVQVLAIEPGMEDLEKQRHAELNNFRARGREWYHDTEEVQQWIAKVVEANGPPRVIKERTSSRHSPKVYYPVTTRFAVDGT